MRLLKAKKGAAAAQRTAGDLPLAKKKQIPLGPPFAKGEVIPFNQNDDRFSCPLLKKGAAAA